MIKKLIQLITLGAMSFNLWANDISQESLLEMMKSDNKPLLIDVRSLKEYQNGHISGAINIPHGNIAEQIKTIGLDKSQTIVLYCRSGYRAGKAAKALNEQGFLQLSHLEGDFLAWQKNKRPIVTVNP